MVDKEPYPPHQERFQLRSGRKLISSCLGPSSKKEHGEATSNVGKGFALKIPKKNQGQCASNLNLQEACSEDPLGCLGQIKDMVKANIKLLKAKTLNPINPRDDA